MRPLDEERNTILHYAVYLEDEGMVSYLVHIGRRYQLFPELMMYKNINHLTASAYIGSCSMNSVLPTIVASLMQEAREAIEANQVGPTSRRMIQESLHPHPTFSPLFRTMLCLAVGRFVFHCNWSVSLLLTVVATLNVERKKNFERPQHDKKQKVIPFMSYFGAVHIWWFLATTVLNMCVRTLLSSIIYNIPFPAEFQIVGFIIMLAFTDVLHGIFRLC
jgi:hypothetical protein